VSAQEARLSAREAGLTARSSPLLRGVVEGYYGRPWSGDARRDVIRFMGAHGLDTFVYGPKNDPYHRDRWREPYPADALHDFRATVRVARTAKVRFAVAISPGLDVRYASRDDFAALAAKIASLRSAGVRWFALFFDDIFGGLRDHGDVARYGGTDLEALARAHADLSNRTDRWLRKRGLPGLLFMVPSDYTGSEARPYHGALARALRQAIPIAWTGSGVFSPTLGGAEAAAFKACLGGHPLVLWDNFPVNDTILSHNLHLGPLTGRDAALARVLRGHLLNPMTQPYASLVAIGTAAAYFRDPPRYDPEAAWRATLAELDPGGGLALLAEQTRSSPLDLDDAHAYAAAIARVEATYATDESHAALAALRAEIDRQGHTPALLAEGPLADEIAPWVAELVAHLREACDAVRLLGALKTGDDATVAALSSRFAAVSPLPTITELGNAMGDMLSADIGFDPALGLNVHGKALYPVPFSMTDVRTITGRNVHRRLLEFVAAQLAER
jgi:hyaluronoglucosaminidase